MPSHGLTYLIQINCPSPASTLSLLLASRAQPPPPTLSPIPNFTPLRERPPHTPPPPPSSSEANGGEGLGEVDHVLPQLHQLRILPRPVRQRRAVSCRVVSCCVCRVVYVGLCVCVRARQLSPLRPCTRAGCPPTPHHKPHQTTNRPKQTKTKQTKTKQTDRQTDKQPTKQTTDAPEVLDFGPRLLLDGLRDLDAPVEEVRHLGEVLLREAPRCERGAGMGAGGRGVGLGSVSGGVGGVIG